MNQTPRRNIPVELRKRFIDTLTVLRSAQPDMTEDALWEYTAGIMHSSLVKDWRMFKNDIGLNDVFYCNDHGEYNIAMVHNAGLTAGCPWCFMEDEEGWREECDCD